MRPTILALLASAVIVSATGCAQNTIGELVERTSCGSSDGITTCLRGDVDLYRLDDIEQCFKDGGCDLVDAIVGATWFASECHQYDVEEVREELRRRADSTGSTDTTTTEASTTEKTTAKTTTEATTTEASASAASTTATTMSSTTSSSSSTNTIGSTTAATASTSSTLICSVTKTVSTSACVVTGGKTVSCTATTTAIASCAPGNLCFSSVAGQDVCMKKDDHLTTSGLVVTIAFAVGIFAASAGVLIVNLRARQKAKHDLQAQLMMASSMHENADLENAQKFSQPMQSEANLPLITPGAPRSEQYNYEQHDYSSLEQEYPGSNPFTAGEHVIATGPPAAPKLHPGLGALGRDAHS